MAASCKYGDVLSGSGATELVSQSVSQLLVSQSVSQLVSCITLQV
jgi:hypothetical protein